jgi:hypothetical protein
MAQTTANIFSTAVFYVPESQFHDYRERISNPIVKVPESISGITKTRNWILNKNPNENIVFIDDDIMEIGTFIKGERIKLDDKEPLLIREFEKLFEVAQGFDVNIFGVENGGNKFANHPLQPISLKSIINASCMGIINNGSIFFDERFPVKEDYDLVLREYKKTGLSLKAKYFYIRTEHWENNGGCVDYRTDKMEEDAISLLQQRYPLNIKTGKRKHKHQILISWD